MLLLLLCARQPLLLLLARWGAPSAGQAVERRLSCLLVRPRPRRLRAEKAGPASFAVEVKTANATEAEAVAVRACAPCWHPPRAALPPPAAPTRPGLLGVRRHAASPAPRLLAHMQGRLADTDAMADFLTEYLRNRTDSERVQVAQEKEVAGANRAAVNATVALTAGDLAVGK